MQKIDTEKLYSVLEIVKLGVFKGKAYTGVRGIVNRDMLGENILKAKVLGSGRATRIYIKGSNLIKIITK